MSGHARYPIAAKATPLCYHYHAVLPRFSPMHGPRHLLPQSQLRPDTPNCCKVFLVHTQGVEPGSQALEACMIPLHYVRVRERIAFTPMSSTSLDPRPGKRTRMDAGSMCTTDRNSRQTSPACLASCRGMHTC